MTANPWPIRIVLGLGACVLLLSAFPPIWNVDLFWHIAAGDWILANGALPTTDIFSPVHPDRTWFPFQWLYEVGVAGLEDIVGLQGLRFLSGVVVLAGFGALWYQSGKRDLPMWARVFIVFLIFLLFADRIRVRPHVFNFLFTLSLSSFLLGGWRQGDLKTHTALMVTIMALWANLHAGGALIFLVLLGTIPAGATWDYLRDQEAGKPLLKRAWIVWTSAAITACLMPHFLLGSIHSIQMMGASERLIDEWKPAWSLVTLCFELFETKGLLAPAIGLNGLTPWLLLLGCMGIPVLAKDTAQSKGLGAWLLATGCTVIAIRYGRFAWLCVFPLLYCFECVKPTLASEKGKRVLAVASVLLLGLNYQYQIQVQRTDVGTALERMSQEMDERRFPVAAADFLKTAQITGGAWVLPNWGGYVLWKTYPNIKVLSDGRGNYTEDIAEDIALVYNHRWKPGYGAKSISAYERYPAIDLIVMLTPTLPNGHTLDNWTRIFPPNPNWITEFQLPPGMEKAIKEEVFVRKNRADAIEAAREVWREVGERLNQRFRGGSSATSPLP